MQGPAMKSQTIDGDWLGHLDHFEPQSHPEMVEISMQMGLTKQHLFEIRLALTYVKLSLEWNDQNKTHPGKSSAGSVQWGGALSLLGLEDECLGWGFIVVAMIWLRLRLGLRWGRRRQVGGHRRGSASSGRSGGGSWWGWRRRKVGRSRCGSGSRGCGRGRRQVSGSGSRSRCRGRSCSSGGSCGWRRRQVGGHRLGRQVSWWRRRWWRLRGAGNHKGHLRLGVVIAVAMLVVVLL